ncbi:diacylglyceryl transferase, partial [Kitasatospora sp. NPDC047058]|uniref:roadblock/LC7 domain-containing protein n=1 Tax=Kitasatospora sp. NPDC047058 TaxID=3155620 RepID=UPI0033C84C86
VRDLHVEFVTRDGVARAVNGVDYSVSAGETLVTGQGEFRESLVRGEHGYVATYAAGGSCVLTLLAHPDANVGRLHLEARRSAQRIAALLNETLAPRDPLQP